MSKQIIPTIRREVGTVITEEGVGFSRVPYQIRKKSIVDGFSVNLLVTGRRGLGAATLINSIFLSPLIDQNREDGITVTKNEIFENDICLDTSITTYHKKDVVEILGYIDSKNNEYFEKEQGLSVPKKDSRIHACVYLIPSDHITKEEIHIMRELSCKCNFIPVVAKADSFTPEELSEYKLKVSRTLRDNGIRVFSPVYTEEDDEEHISETADIINRFPLAVYSGTSIYEYEGEIRRGRMYSWGFLDMENEEYNDFMRLRKLLIHCYLDELIYTTDTMFYNEYRKIHMRREGSDELLRKSRLLKMKGEMERILKERNRRRGGKVEAGWGEIRTLFEGKDGTA
jgi:septin 7